MITMSWDSVGGGEGGGEGFLEEEELLVKQETFERTILRFEEPDADQVCHVSL